MTRRLLLSLSTAALILGALASAEASPNPFEKWRRMFEPPRHAARWHAPKYRVRKPVLVKATPNEAPEETATAAHAWVPDAPDIPDAVMPIPEARPIAIPALPVEPGIRVLSDIPEAVLPIPEARPAGPPKPEVMPPLPAEKPVAADASGAPPSGKTSGGKGSVKLASLTPATESAGEKPVRGSSALAALGVKSIPLDAIEKGPCTVLDPVSISAFESGDVALTGKAVLNDRMAETVAKWVHEVVVPAAHEVLAGDLTGLRVLDSYNCRSRDNVAGAKISEHGFANAIDIGAFRIGKRWIEVGGDKHNAADDARFLDTVRHAACHSFTTVLGPGEPAHDNHFHLDLARHGKTGKYTICQ